MKWYISSTLRSLELSFANPSDPYHWRVAVIRSSVCSRRLVSETCATWTLWVDL